MFLKFSKKSNVVLDDRSDLKVLLMRLTVSSSIED